MEAKKNYIEDINSMLGITKDIAVNVYDQNNSIVTRVKSCEELDSEVLFEVLKGHYKVENEKWIPEYNEFFYMINQDGLIKKQLPIQLNKADFVAQVNIGNCFKTKEMAYNNVYNMLKKFEKVLISGQRKGNINYMPKVANILGLNINERFDVIFGFTDVPVRLSVSQGHKFTETSFVNILDKDSKFALYYLITGKYKILRRKFKPKEKGNFFYVPTNGIVIEDKFYKTSFVSLLLFNMGNCFETKEEAQNNVKKMLKKYDSIKKASLEE